MAGCDNGASILIQGNLLAPRRSGTRRPPPAPAPPAPAQPARGAATDGVRRLGQGARVIGTEGLMELWTGRPPLDQIVTRFGAN